MDKRIGELRTVHVVYVLSRGGHLEHPHLIRVYPVVRNGVRLKDVKRWLSNLRGKDMPNSFSWSYKRRYKSGYVWQDLRDDDLITPVCDNEYVLKGSLNSPIYQDMCTCSGNTPAVQKSMPNKYELPELAAPKVLMLELDSTKGHKNHEEISNLSDAESCKEIENFRSNNNIFLHYDEIPEVENVDTIEYVTKTSGNSPSRVSDGSGRDEAAKVYKAIRNSSNLRLDAATQTGDSTRCYDKEESLPLLGVIADAVSPKVVTAKKKSVGKMNSSKVILENQKFTSKFTCMGSDVVLPASNSESIIKSATKELCQAKVKSSTTASHLLRQLFSCGAIDTRDYGIRNIKAPKYHHAPMDESSDGSAVILPCTPCKKTEYQTNSMNSESFSEVPSAGNLSVTNGGQSDASVSKRSDRNLKRQCSFAEVAACQKSLEELHLPLTSSRECLSEKNIVDISSPEGNSYSRVELNGSPHASSINTHETNITKTLAKASTPSKKIQKGSQSSAMLLDDFSYRSTTIFSNPRNYSKNSRKIKAPEGSINGSAPNAKQNVQSCCMQCGRAVKPEYLKAHTKYCRGQRIGKVDAKATTIMAK